MLLNERTRIRSVRLALVVGVWAPTLLLVGVCWRASRPTALRRVLDQIEAATNLQATAQSVVFPRPGVVRLVGLQLRPPDGDRSLAAASRVDLIDQGDHLEIQCDRLVLAAGELAAAGELWRHAERQCKLRRQHAVRLSAEEVACAEGDATVFAANEFEAAVSPLREDWQAWASWRVAGAERVNRLWWSAEGDQRQRVRLDVGAGRLPGRLATLISARAGEALHDAQVFGRLEAVWAGDQLERASVPEGSVVGAEFAQCPLPGGVGPLSIGVNRLSVADGRIVAMRGALWGRDGRWDVQHLRRAANALGCSLSSTLGAAAGSEQSYSRLGLQFDVEGRRLHIGGSPRATDPVMIGPDGAALMTAGARAISAVRLADAIAPAGARSAPLDGAATWLASHLSYEGEQLAAALRERGE